MRLCLHSSVIRMSFFVRKVPVYNSALSIMGFCIKNDKKALEESLVPTWNRMVVLVNGILHNIGTGTGVRRPLAISTDITCTLDEMSAGNISLTDHIAC